MVPLERLTYLHTFYICVGA
uniref:Uncharacterized protein n=1 Tax=Anguilla anguilla TaxID=7936 RepID=A0A0E9U288_ANGAN